MKRLAAVFTVALTLSIGAVVSATAATALPSPAVAAGAAPAVTAAVAAGRMLAPVSVSVPAGKHFSSGTLSLAVTVLGPRRLAVDIVLVVVAQGAGRGQFYVALCSSHLDEPCNDQQRYRAFSYKAGANRVRWRTTIVGLRPINTLSVGVFDDPYSVGAAAFINSPIRG